MTWAIRLAKFALFLAIGGLLALAVVAGMSQCSPRDRATRAIVGC